MKAPANTTAIVHRDIKPDNVPRAVATVTEVEDLERENRLIALLAAAVDARRRAREDGR